MAAYRPGMAKRELTENWSIDLDDSFEGRIVDDSLQLVSLGPPMRTVWINVWGSAAASTTDTLSWIKAESNPNALRRFEEQSNDGDQLRFAAWYPELDDDGQHWTLHAYTVRPEGFVNAAIETESEDDLEWALAVWRSCEFQSV